MHRTAMRPTLSCPASRRRLGGRAPVGSAVVLAALAIAPAAGAAGTWTKAPVNPTTGGNAFGLWMLTDGTVLSHGSALNHWVVLTPDKKGSYANGTWKSVANSVHARGGAQQHMLKDGRFFQAGGEFIDGPACTAALCPTAEIYDPVANAWTDAATAPFDIGDTGSANLADGRILDSTRAGSQIQIYDPTTDRWTQGPSMPLSTGDENSWVSLQNGGVLAVGFDTDGAAIYDPASNAWKRTAVPAGFRTGDTGGISLMFDGRVLVYGFGQTYIYTPGATATDPGTWALGPKMLNGDEAEDEFSDPLPNGKVWGALTQVQFGPGVILQEFDPLTNTVSSATPPSDTGNPYPIGYVNLPNGQVMVTAASADWIYTPDTLPDDSWRPVVTSVVFNSGSTYTLTGMQLSGLINGSDEGDDMTNAQNYPIVWLTDGAGDVFYCRTFNFSNMMPSKGAAPETCQFTTPAGLPDGTYNLFVSAVGVSSKDPVGFTVGVGSTGDGGIPPAGSGSGGPVDAGQDAAAPGSGAADGGHDATTGSTRDGGPDAGQDASGGGNGPGSGSSGGSSGTASSGGATGSSGGKSGSSSSAGSATGSGGSSGGGAADASSGAGATGGDNRSGCGCTTVGASPSGGRLGAVGGLAVLVALVRRRRRARSI